MLPEVVFDGFLIGCCDLILIPGLSQLCCAVTAQRVLSNLQQLLGFALANCAFFQVSGNHVH